MTARGVRRTAIFRDETDRLDYLRLLGRVVEEAAWQCLAYCQMTNHFHLLVRTPRPTISTGMWLLNGVYAKRFNERHDLSGHVFERRFAAELIEDERHAFQAARYVVLNPVRARICSSPADWPWSSYRATVGIDSPPCFLDVDWLLHELGPPGARVAAFRAFVHEALPVGQAA